MKSEEDLQPLTRQRSNTLPKSFGSQLEKKPAQEKVPKPPAETTLESILKKLQEKREEVNRPEDIKVRLWCRHTEVAACNEAAAICACLKTRWIRVTSEMH